MQQGNVWAGAPEGIAKEGGKQREIRQTFKMLSEIWLSIGIEKTDIHKGIIVKALLDSGATGMFIDRRTAAKCYNQSHFIQVFTIMQLHGQLLYFMLLYISNSSVSISLVRHVLYLADLMSVIFFPHLLLMVHRYIYSRYSLVFGMLYQLYHFLLSYDGKYPINNIISFLFYIITNFSILNSCCLLL